MPSASAKPSSSAEPSHAILVCSPSIDHVTSSSTSEGELFKNIFNMVGGGSRLGRLIIPPSHPAPPPIILPTPSSPAFLLVPTSPVPVPIGRQVGLFQGHSSLAQLAEIVDRRANYPTEGLARPSVPLFSTIKGDSGNSTSIIMPPSTQPPLENSTLTSALHDVSVSLEARQKEVDQLRTSVLERVLPGPPRQTLLERFQDMENDFRSAQEDWNKFQSRSESSSRRNRKLERSLVQEQALEEIHHFRDHPSFLEQMVREFPEEGFYEVSLPPVSKLEGELAKMSHWVATFAHHLYRSTLGNALHHHNRHLGGLIEAVLSFLRHGMDSSDPDVVSRHFRAALEYMQAIRGIHGELNIRTQSSLHWFFDNMADRKDGLYQLVLDYSRFSDDAPFLTVAQHAGYVAPFDNSLEPPLHHRMFALDAALPYHGAGRWEDTVPALPSLDELTWDWEHLMVEYIHYLADMPLLGPPTMTDVAVGAGLDVPSTRSTVASPLPLFLLEQDSPNSPFPPPISSRLPPLFGSVAPLVIDLTANNDDSLYKLGYARSLHLHSEVEPGDGMDIDQKIPIKDKPPVM
ncbi:hypothetical protein EV368DRAFT_88131 [Lentinula lateritia]|nr:hypothetical protein EV368DRAFT_88131 [Lentinula lateritia]